MGIDGMMNSILARSAVRSAARPTFAVARRNKSAAAAEAGGLDTVLKADHSTTALHLYHKTNLLAIGLTPLAFVVPESVPVLPCVLNVFLGVVFPIHGHIGMAGVLTLRAQNRWQRCSQSCTIRSHGLNYCDCTGSA